MSFASAASQMIHRHGMTSTYTRILTGEYDPNTSTVINSSQQYSIVMYMKQLKVNQFSYSNLIGKEVSMFYLVASDIDFIPSPQDLITYNSKTYKVDSYQSHTALGSVILYRIIGVV